MGLALRVWRWNDRALPYAQSVPESARPEPSPETILDSLTESGPDTSERIQDFEMRFQYFLPSPGTTHPDGRGGVLATWSERPWEPIGHLSHVGSSGTVTALRSWPTYFPELSMITDAGTAFVYDWSNSTITARATDTWDILYALNGLPIVSFAEGGALVDSYNWETNTQAIEVVDAAGTVTDSYPVPSGISHPRVIHPANGILHGVDNDGKLAAIKTTISAESAWSYQRNVNVVMGCNPNIPFWQYRTPFGPTLTYGFDNSWSNKTNLQAEVLEALRLWA